jgi:uncharacterized protein YwgA
MPSTACAILATVGEKDSSGLDQTDLILVLLAAETKHRNARFRVDGITRLEKLLFLLAEEDDYKGFKDEIAEPFTFEAYHYGPYSKEVYSSVDLLKALRLLREKRVDVKSGLDLNEESEVLGLSLPAEERYVERQFILTDDGRAVARLLSTRLSPAAKQMLTDLKDRFARMPLRQLLRYVYANHPKYAEKSLIKETL